LIDLPLIADLPNRLEDQKSWVYTGILLFLFTAGYRLINDRYDPVLWFGVCALIGLGGLVFGIKSAKNKKPEV
jgi:hypothetical protein